MKSQLGDRLQVEHRFDNLNKLKYDKHKRGRLKPSPNKRMAINSYLSKYTKEWIKTIEHKDEFHI